MLQEEERSRKIRTQHDIVIYNATNI
jgi:hypothetical protein